MQRAWRRSAERASSRLTQLRDQQAEGAAKNRKTIDAIQAMHGLAWGEAKFAPPCAWVHPVKLNSPSEHDFFTPPASAFQPDAQDTEQADSSLGLNRWPAAQESLHALDASKFEAVGAQDVVSYMVVLGSAAQVFSAEHPLKLNA